MRGAYTEINPAIVPAKCAANVPALGTMRVPSASSNHALYRAGTGTRPPTRTTEFAGRRCAAATFSAKLTPEKPTTPLL